MKRAVVILAIVYLLLLVTGALFIRTDDGSLWFVTLFLFSPRWIVAVPLVVLVPLTMWARWRWTWVYIVHGLIIAALMGFQIPSTRPIIDRSAPSIRLITYNLGSGDIDIDALTSLVAEHEVDVLLLQECTPSTSAKLFGQLGWEYRQQHNIAIGSSFPLGEVRELARQPKENYSVVAAIGCELTWPARRADGGTDDPVLLFSVHLPTFRPALEVARQLNLKQTAAALKERRIVYRQVVEQLVGKLPGDVPSLIGGDFNVPVESVDYRDYWHGYHNAHGEAGTGFGYTKHTRYHGIRIDHLLFNDDWAALQSFAGPNLGGDHCPVITTLMKRAGT